MGIDIATYRCRIGVFASKYETTVAIVTINIARCFKTIGCLWFIGTLLFIAGIELNPGPLHDDQEYISNIELQPRNAEIRVELAAPNVTINNQYTALEIRNSSGINIGNQTLNQTFGSQTEPSGGVFTQNTDFRLHVVRNYPCLNYPGPCYPGRSSEHLDTYFACKKGSVGQHGCKNCIKGNIIDITKELIEGHVRYGVYVETKAYREVIKKLQLNNVNVAIVTGLPGDGKTTLAMEIMQRISKGLEEKFDKCLPFRISTALQWQSVVNASEKQIILLDDIFGKYFFNQSRFDDWDPLFRNMADVCVVGNVLVIISVRKIVLQELYTRLVNKDETIFRDKCVVDLSSFVLEKHKTSICQTHYDKSLLHLNSADSIRTIVDDLSKEKAIGFPGLCDFFFLDKEIDNSDSLKRRTSFIRILTETNKNRIEYLMKFDIHKYVTLVYIFFSKSQVALQTSVIKYIHGNEKDTLQHILGLHSISYDDNTIYLMKESALIMTGEFLLYKVHTKTYEFASRNISFGLFATLKTRYSREFIFNSCPYLFLKSIHLVRNTNEDVLPNLRLEYEDHYYNRFIEELTEEPEQFLKEKFLDNSTFAKDFVKVSLKLNKFSISRLESVNLTKVLLKIIKSVMSSNFNVRDLTFLMRFVINVLLRTFFFASTIPLFLLYILGECDGEFVILGICIIAQFYILVLLLFLQDWFIKTYILRNIRVRIERHRFVNFVYLICRYYGRTF